MRVASKKPQTKRQASRRFVEGGFSFKSKSPCQRLSVFLKTEQVLRLRLGEVLSLKEHSPDSPPLRMTALFKPKILQEVSRSLEIFRQEFEDILVDLRPAGIDGRAGHRPEVMTGVFDHDELMRHARLGQGRVKHTGLRRGHKSVGITMTRSMGGSPALT